MPDRISDNRAAHTPARASTLDKRFLSIYLNDHLAGATAGRSLARRMTQAAGGPVERERLRKVCQEISEDADALRDIMRRLGVRVDPLKAAAAWAAEKAGRLKPNGHLVHRSPLSNLVELEAMLVGVSGKLAGWTVLREIAAQTATDGLDVDQLDRLIGRAEGQLALLQKIHLRVGASVLTTTGQKQDATRTNSQTAPRTTLSPGAVSNHQPR